jgi:hypothetical protein
MVGQEGARRRGSRKPVPPSAPATTGRTACPSCRRPTATGILRQLDPGDGHARAVPLAEACDHADSSFVEVEPRRTSTSAGLWRPGPRRDGRKMMAAAGAKVEELTATAKVRDLFS